MIYFTQDSGNCNVKIGYTGSDQANGRTRALQTGNSCPLVVLATMPGTQEDEAVLHRRFSSARVAGEWFRPVPELLQLICDAKKQKQSTADVYPWPLHFYFAGKINAHGWRHTIVSGLKDQFSMVYHGPNQPASDLLQNDWPILSKSIEGTHHYVGPYFINYEHGEVYGAGDDEHGIALNRIEPKVSGSHLPRADVVGNCLAAIRRCDVLFAWIDQLDCYGTIVEAGYAHACGKMVWAAGPREYRDMWFLYEMATYAEFRNPEPKWSLVSMLMSYFKEKDNILRHTQPFRVTENGTIQR